MPILNLNFYVIAVLVVTNLLTIGFWRSCNEELKIIEVRGAVAEENAKFEIEQQKKITEDTTNGWKAALLTTRRYYDARRVRIDNAGQMPTCSDATIRSDATSQDAIPPAARVEEDCAVTTLNLNLLQSWAERQQSADR